MTGAATAASISTGIDWYDDAAGMAEKADIDVLVELIGGDNGPAMACVKAALKAGRHVVTANKALLASHGLALARDRREEGRAAELRGCGLPAGIPIIKTMREAMAANTISRVFGILNGTCNYILTRMEAEKIDFADCLADAQRLGYAEADPTFDIEGQDTAHKLAILTSLAFGTKISPDDIYLEGISNITQADIRAAARARLPHQAPGRGAPHGDRHRAACPSDHGADRLRHRAGSWRHQCGGHRDRHARRAAPVGPGGGRRRHRLLGDRRPRRHRQEPARFPARPRLRPSRCASCCPTSARACAAMRAGYFIRLSVRDRAGVFAAVAKRMAENNISLESIVQHANGQNSPDVKTVILVTHETMEASVRKAVEKITGDGHLIDKAQVIRIERAA